MKRKMQRFVTVSTAAALSLAMAVPGSAAYQPEQKFQDVSRSAPYYEDVMDANYYGLMAGVSGKTFDTESTITRAMWVTMLYKMAGQPAVQSKDTFTDVKTGDWFAQAATWAVEQGITAGYEDGSFGVNQTITRQEMAVMASKFAAQYKDAVVSASANLAGYADAGELDSWASEAMSWALSSGVMQAVDGKLSPKSTVSRANTAGVAVRLYELGGVDLDTITALEKDWTQAAQLPLTGWFTKNIDVEGDRQVTVYISKEASIRSYFTVIAVPNGVDTQQFLEDEGWIDLMDQKGEGLFVLEPGAEGWGSAAEEKAYMDAAIAFLKSGNNIHKQNVFSTFGEFYLAGYGKGAAALELNIFLQPTDRHRSAQELEQEYADVVRRVAEAVKIPVSVKLPMRLTNVLSVGDALLGRGAGGLVLYNRFFEPDIDIEKMCLVNGDPFSEPGELRNVLRSTALCAHALPQLDIAVSTGVHDGAAAVKSLLCGAAAVQVCTAIHRYGYEVIGEMNRFIDAWAARQGFESLDEFRGRMDYGSSEGDFYQRVQYMKYFPHDAE